jgi:hypothetical protein
MEKEKGNVDTPQGGTSETPKGAMENFQYGADDEASA